MKLNNIFYSSFALIALYSEGCKDTGKENEEQAFPRPNIILIMGDDIGFSDLGCYGSEIQTPNLDLLAENGLQYRTFYNSSKYNPSRSNLMTGLYMGDNRAINMAHILGDNGYATIHCGKEHFDKWVPERCLAKNAFDYSFYKIGWDTIRKDRYEKMLQLGVITEQYKLPPLLRVIGK